jgi:AraC-like DNA-binding protein
MTIHDMNPNTTRPWVISGTILAIVEFLERTGFDPEAVLTSAEMKMVEAADPYRHVDLEQIMNLFQRVANLTNRDDIGLVLGSSVDIRQLGPFGYLMLNAPNVGTALSDFVRFGGALQSDAHFSLSIEGELTSLCYSSNHTEYAGWALDNEVSIGYLMAIVRGVTGQQMNPTTISFEHEPLCDIKSYLQILGERPFFNEPINRVSFPKKILERPIKNADPLLFRVLQRHLSDLVDAVTRNNNLPQQVANNIRRGLGSSTVSLEHIAAELGFEPRTLQRKLDALGTSFREIDTRERLRKACYYLEQTTVSVSEIAAELGYTDSSAFSRAFKGWSGKSPLPYRNERGTGACSSQ